MPSHVLVLGTVPPPIDADMLAPWPKDRFSRELQMKYDEVERETLRAVPGSYGCFSASVVPFTV